MAMTMNPPPFRPESIEAFRARYRELTAVTYDADATMSSLDIETASRMFFDEESGFRVAMARLRDTDGTVCDWFFFGTAPGGPRDRADVPDAPSADLILTAVQLLVDVVGDDLSAFRRHCDQENGHLIFFREVPDHGEPYLAG